MSRAGSPKLKGVPGIGSAKGIFESRSSLWLPLKKTNPENYALVSLFERYSSQLNTTGQVGHRLERLLKIAKEDAQPFQIVSMHYAICPVLCCACAVAFAGVRDPSRSEFEPMMCRSPSIVELNLRLCLNI